jgi:ribosome biogenesis GTPase A
VTRALTDAEQVIQWYPGHMAKAMRRIEERIKLVDIIIEVIDARLPASSTNPRLSELAGNRPRLVVITRQDLADARRTKEWIAHLQSRGQRAVSVNAKAANGLSVVRYYLGLLTGHRKNLRAIVVGMPNTGKSTVINGLIRRSAAKAENKPGVTRQIQWFRVHPNLELMDSPGIMAPKIENLQAQWQLALTGMIPRERFDAVDVVNRFWEWLMEQTGGHTHVPCLMTFAKTRNFLRKGAEPDLHNAAVSYLHDLNEGKFGRFSLEQPPPPVSPEPENTPV